MYTSRKKIQKDKDVEPSEFEESVAQTSFVNDFLAKCTSEIRGIEDMSIFGGIRHKLLTSTRTIISTRSISTYQMKDGRNYIIRTAGLEDYERVIKLQMEELRQDVSDTKLLQDAQVLADRCRGGYQCLVAIYLDPKARNDTEYKLETFSGVYRKLSGKDVVFEYPMTEA
ncbi:ribosomal protein S7e [Artemisia annua]|uniref:40S ribosomal protein S7 n=1 Tax=Artemisia annua TaxID=35608 RepID=A0A2U1LQ10_ARTAN|nr:ribosomal protein S7e [Artemisia annua]